MILKQCEVYFQSVTRLRVTNKINTVLCNFQSVTYSRVPMKNLEIDECIAYLQKRKQNELSILWFVK